jgi:hypothetical protein
MFTTSQVARTKMLAAALFGVAIVSTALRRLRLRLR